MSEITGTVYSVGLEEKITDNFSKAQLVVETDEQYPQKIAIEFVNKKIELLKKLRVSQSVKVNYNLRGREWADPNSGELKYFNTIQGWRVEVTAEPDASQQQHPFPPIDPDDLNSEEYDDLPF